MTANIYPLSYSRINTFEQCNYRFEKQYVLQTHRSQDSTESIFGKRVHKHFEDYLKDDAPLPDFLRSFKGLLDRAKAAPGEKFYEYQLALTGNQQPCDWDHKQCYVRGIADFAAIDGPKGRACDWKTGKPRDNIDQMKMMATLMLLKHPELESVDTTYVWLYHKVPSEVITYTRDMLPDLWAWIKKKVTAIEEALELGVFKAKPSGLCPWCPVYETCAFARRR